MENKEHIQTLSFLSNLFLEVLPDMVYETNVFVCINDVIPLLDEPSDVRRWAAKKRIETIMSNYAIPYLSRNNVRLTDFGQNCKQSVPDDYFDNCHGAEVMIDRTQPITIYCPYYNGSQKRTEESIFMRPFDLQRLMLSYNKPSSYAIQLCVLSALNTSPLVRTVMSLEAATMTPAIPHTSDLLSDACDMAFNMDKYRQK